MVKIEKNIQSSVGEVIKATLKRKDLELIVYNYGASVYSLKFNNREMTVRPDDLDGFLKAQFYYGKTCGRTGGRLIAPSYQIDGISYPVKPYRGETTKLHGGKEGFSFKHFELSSTKEEKDQDAVTFKLISPDGDEDYPGELTLFVTYQIDDTNNMRILYEATTTKDTLCSITNHMYFNLNGEKKINDHYVQIDASKYIELDEDLIPLKKADVKDTPFDLRQLQSINKPLEDLEKTPIGGYDHTWVFDQKIGTAFILDQHKEYELKVITDYPAVVVFTHNVPSTDHVPARYGDGTRSALTMECEYEPAGIHYPFMNSAILRKDEKYTHFIDFSFKHLT